MFHYEFTLATPLLPARGAGWAARAEQRKMAAVVLFALRSLSLLVIGRIGSFFSFLFVSSCLRPLSLRADGAYSSIVWSPCFTVMSSFIGACNTEAEIVVSFIRNPIHFCTGNALTL